MKVSICASLTRIVIEGENMLKIFLCDDDYEMLTLYARLLRIIADKNKLVVKISIFKSGEQLINKMLLSKEHPDIVYLDILMKSLNGIETAKKIRKLGCQTEIVFLTASEDYLFDSFDVKPVQYLLKEETSEKRFEQIFLRAAELVNGERANNFLVETTSFLHVIPISKISHFAINRRKVTVHYEKDKSISYYHTMNMLDKELENKNFVRIHRGYIVNLQYIRRLEREKVILIDDCFLPVGATYYERVNAELMKYITSTNTVIFERNKN